SEDEIRAQLREIWSAMQSCVARGIREEGVLPGGLKVGRRAPALYRELSSAKTRSARSCARSGVRCSRAWHAASARKACCRV
ncbi:hypothetical protein C7E12_21740, partial [Stenotrophomonas maltophilia]